MLAISRDLIPVDATVEYTKSDVDVSLLSTSSPNTLYEFPQTGVPSRVLNFNRSQLRT